GWRIDTGRGAIRAGTVVNAAGAWADEIAVLAGATLVGLVPKRRTAMIVSAPEGVPVSGYPTVVDIDEEFYLKPESGRLLISPADETPSPPCDAQPEEIDIAICVDRIERAFDLKVARIDNKWAGLRSFVADKVPVAGYDPSVPGFFWLAGQGGYGIQSAPALARCAAALVLRNDPPADIVDHGLDVRALRPERAACRR
ncbi:MAG: FAD-binding oxidoreductase, partial [Nitratireductor sp.]